MNMLPDTSVAILVGGAGTRLRSMVADRPKVLAPVNGQPFLVYVLEQLAEQGVANVVLCTGHMGGQIREFFGDEFRGLSLTYSDEERPLGTGGAIVNALPLLPASTLLVLNGDSYVQTDFHMSLAWHLHQQALATVVMTRVDDTSRYGRIEFSSDGRITMFCEKAEDRSPGWINGGAYWFQRSVFECFTIRDPLSLERDVLGGWTGAGLFGFKNEGRFIDIGIPSDYSRVGAFLTDCQANAAVC